MSPPRLVRLAALAAAAYAIGSVQIPRIVQRLVSDEPPTDHFTLEWGDGHVIRFDAAGSTTVEVTLGPKLGALTSVVDMSKSIIPVLLLRRARPGEPHYAVWATAAAVGQMLPPQHRFRGGRAEALITGTCLVLDPPSVPLSVAVSQFIGIYLLRDPLVGAHGWTAVLPLYFALRGRRELVLYALIIDVVRYLASIPEMRQMWHYYRAGEFQTREFHEAFESNHIGYIHKWLRQRGLIRYGYMDRPSGSESHGPAAPVEPRAGSPAR